MAAEERACQSCGGAIPAYTTAYTLRLQLFAEAGPIDITPDDLAADHERRMKELIESAMEADPEELMDQVFESYTLTVCAKCRNDFHNHFAKFLKTLKDKI